MSLSNTSDQIYTQVDCVTGHVDGEVGLTVLSSLTAPLELDEMYVHESSQALKAGDLSDMVVLSPDNELNSSSIMDETVLEKTKAARSARSGSSFFKNPSDTYYTLVKEFQDVVCHNPFSVLPPDRAYVMKLTWFLGPNTTLKGSGLYQRNNLTSMTGF